MPDQWVSGDGLTVEAQLEHERRVARRLREAYRLAETRSTEAQTKLRQIRLALDELILSWQRGTDAVEWKAADAVQEVLDDFAR